MAKQTTEWPNEPTPEPMPASTRQQQPMLEPTQRDVSLAALAEKDKEVKRQRYDITNGNQTATRVVHDVSGNAITIPPGETKRSVVLRTTTAAYLGRGDLVLTAAT